MYGYSLEHTNFYVIQPGLIWMFMPEADTLALQLSMKTTASSLITKF